MVYTLPILPAQSLPRSKMIEENSTLDIFLIPEMQSRMYHNFFLFHCLFSCVCSTRAGRETNRSLAFGTDDHHSSAATSPVKSMRSATQLPPFLVDLWNGASDLRTRSKSVWE